MSQRPADLDRRLHTEQIVWLSTARRDGRPHLIPIWFSWDGESVLIFSRPEAQKVDNVRHNPDVMLAIGEPEDDFDVHLIEGRAEPLDRATAEVIPPSHLRKYREQMRRIGLSVEEYVRTYSQPIRIVPARFVGWTGRTRLAGA